MKVRRYKKEVIPNEWTKQKRCKIWVRSIHNTKKDQRSGEKNGGVVKGLLTFFIEF